MNTADPKDLLGEAPSAGLDLPGLDGSNPLGFLAALGLLRLLHATGNPKQVKLSWIARGGTWIPVLHRIDGPELHASALLEELSRCVVGSISEHPVRILQTYGDVGEDRVGRRRAAHADLLAGDRSKMDWIAAFMSDAASPSAINQLQTTRRDYFYGNLTSIIARTEAEHLGRSIFRPWDYGDALDNQSLHLDPTEDRRHAYQWNKPAGDPNRKARGGMLGANRLALEAIPIFTSFPEGGMLRTLGFTGTKSTNTRWTWPIWGPPLSLDPIRSLLALSILQEETFNRTDLASLKGQGVVAVYRTRRILVEKTPNFTPTTCIA